MDTEARLSPSVKGTVWGRLKGDTAASAGGGCADLPSHLCCQKLVEDPEDCGAQKSSLPTVTQKPLPFGSIRERRAARRMEPAFSLGKKITDVAKLSWR